MKLYSRLPYHVEVSGKRYKINPSFDRVLEAVDILNNQEWTEAQKINYLSWLLIKSRCKVPVLVINAAIELLIKGDNSSERTLDFAQDWDLIYAAFVQSYGIDLFKQRGKLHWMKFAALVSALPSNTRISEIIDIRTREIPEPTKYNQKERTQLIKLKAKHRLKVSESEKETMYQQAMQNIAQMLINMAERGDR